jgi:RHS repeat-associated protein
VAEVRWSKSLATQISAKHSFKYDPFGRRIEKISPTATSIFVYDGDNLIQTVNASGSTVARYTQGQNIDEPLALQQSTTIDYYEVDGLGSVTSVSSTTGTVAQSYAYDSFGNTTNSAGSLTNFFRYTAREFDTETGLYYYRARYYDPTVGRFLGEDPLRFGAGAFARSVRPLVDFYSYVGNNPVSQVDPTGLWQFEFGGGYGGGVLVTFGHNSGQWNFGFYGGFEGGFFSFDPSDSSCHTPGFVGGLRNEGDIGVTKGGYGLSASNEIDVNGESSSNITAYTPSGASFNYNPGNPSEPPHGVLGAGAGAFFGAGGTTYFPSGPCGCGQ